MLQVLVSACQSPARVWLRAQALPEFAKVFQNLQAKLFAKPVSLLFDLGNLLRVLSVIFEVEQQFVSGVNKMRSLFVPLLHAGIGKLLDSLN